MKTKRVEKKCMQIYYPQIGETDFFFDGDEIITSIDGNDGNYRAEYMNCLFEHFGIQVKVIKTLNSKQKEAFDAYSKEYDLGYNEGEEDAND